MERRSGAELSTGTGSERSGSGGSKYRHSCCRRACQGRSSKYPCAGMCWECRRAWGRRCRENTRKWQARVVKMCGLMCGLATLVLVIIILTLMTFPSSDMVWISFPPIFSFPFFPFPLQFLPLHHATTSFSSSSSFFSLAWWETFQSIFTDFVFYFLTSFYPQASTG